MLRRGRPRKVLAGELVEGFAERVGAPRTALAKMFHYRLSGKIGSYFSCFSAAHSVSDNVEAEIVVKPHNVFIVVSYAADISETEGLQHEEDANW